MSRRLSKSRERCKKWPVWAALALPVAAFAAEPAPDLGATLRDCVRQAASPAEISACEGQARRGLAERITHLNGAILARLDAPQQKLFEANVAAWERFVSAEERMFGVAFGSRPDGLGAQLTAGAFNELLEHRVARLRDYLSSLPN